MPCWSLCDMWTAGACLRISALTLMPSGVWREAPCLPALYLVVQSLSRVQLLVTLCDPTVVRQAPLSMGFSRQ